MSIAAALAMDCLCELGTAYEACAKLGYIKE